ncbi:hypothetical protein [Mongoliitalea lutea]|uniref:Uncharacterized protein n=1 Tax=Mongoliitalea lutea TaxID=849756 RepID=A0A8J3G3X8_9BACT|nr:hypothetical protein [Mongoliitalea lutea]GHB26335.1 hypothetical protein GCM10008106_03720 [Mongoliitalea lutea]
MEEYINTCKIVSVNYSYQPLELKTDEIDLALNFLNLTVNSTKANKLFYLKMRLQSLSLQEAVDVLVDSWFYKKISADKLAFYKRMLLTDVSYLFASEPYQREFLIINNLTAILFDQHERFQKLTDVFFTHPKNFIPNAYIFFDELSKNTLMSSMLHKWKNEFDNKLYAKKIITDITPYFQTSHRVLINSFWLKKEDVFLN